MEHQELNCEESELLGEIMTKYKQEQQASKSVNNLMLELNADMEKLLAKPD